MFLCRKMALLLLVGRYFRLIALATAELIPSAPMHALIRPQLSLVPNSRWDPINLINIYLYKELKGVYNGLLNTEHRQSMRQISNLCDRL